MSSRRSLFSLPLYFLLLLLAMREKRHRDKNDSGGGTNTAALLAKKMYTQCGFFSMMETHQEVRTDT